VTPGPTLPASELLGDPLMAPRRPAAAPAAHRRSLALYPRRFNSLLGPPRAARGAGDEASARAYYRELLEVAHGRSRTEAIVEARAFVRGGR
jgi:hypothetical protein